MLENTQHPALNGMVGSDANVNTNTTTLAPQGSGMREPDLYRNPSVMHIENATARVWAEDAEGSNSNMAIRPRWQINIQPGVDRALAGHQRGITMGFIWGITWGISLEWNPQHRRKAQVNAAVRGSHGRPDSSGEARKAHGPGRSRRGRDARGLATAPSPTNEFRRIKF